MCQIDNILMERVGDIIAYKVFTKRTLSDGTQIFRSIYQEMRYVLNKTYTEKGGGYMKNHRTPTIESGYFHAFTTEAGARRFAAQRNRWMHAYYPDLYPEAVVGKVVLHNSKKGDEVYSGRMMSLDGPYPTFASKRLTLIEVFDDVPV